jgi:hypothetical protein
MLRYALVDRSPSKLSCCSGHCAFLQAEKCNLLPRVPILTQVGEAGGAEYKWMRDGTVTIEKRVNINVQSAESELVLATGYFGCFHWKRALCHSK